VNAQSFGLKPSRVTEWFAKKFGTPTPPQKLAWPVFTSGQDLLVISATGTGKTFAAFLGILSELAAAQANAPLPETIYAVYVSPLRALSYDLEKNLREPLREIYGEKAAITVGLRSGDTTSAERVRQFNHPPHILLTTPESLSLLLSQPKWLPVLQTVRWVVIDEIHSLAENKRGSHLSLSLERLSHLIETGREKPGSIDRPPRIQRIGLSATVAPVQEVGAFLTGNGRPCQIVDASSAKKIDLKVFSPLKNNPYPPSGYTGIRLIQELARLIKENQTTLVFTNTRSGAEAAAFWLKEQLPELSSQVECHHASLDRDVRLEVEDRLKKGELRAVVCSTSLELGIDIGSVDLVVMLSTPKGVSRALQRTGRAGHSINKVSRGLIMATNLNDLVECCATALLARSRQLDPIRLRESPLDVLAQHLVSMGCIKRWNRAEAFDLVCRSRSYRDLPIADFNAVLEYLAGGGKSLQKQYSETFGKIELDEESFATRTGVVRRDLLQNIGVIPNEGMVAVKLKGRTLGLIEEIFVRQLQPGDIFILAGRPVRLERMGLMECFVARADSGIPTVPRWNAAKMPLTNKVAEEIVAFRSEIRPKLQAWDSKDSSLLAWVADRLECGEVNARIILEMHAAQMSVSDLPTIDFFLVEELLESEVPSGLPEGTIKLRGPKRRPRSVPARHYFFHCLAGRPANEALSRVVTLRLSRLRGGNAVATADDYGFVLTVSLEQKISESELRELLSPENFCADLEQSLSRSHLLKYHFRNAAQTGMMVYRNFFGEQKSMRKLQWSAEVIFNVLKEHEPDHVLLREAYQDAVHTYIDADGALDYLQRLRNRQFVMKQVPQVPPLSFALFATKIKEALLVEDPREMTERLFHIWWEKLHPGGDAAGEQSQA
jgi:ATP-dependent Lhr-like helicase